jgi:hypothetical protein
MRIGKGRLCENVDGGYFCNPATHVQFIATPQVKRPQGLIACIMNSIYRVNMDGKDRISMQEIF